MRLDQAIYGLLSTTGAVTALVGTRIYPLILPQDVTWPAVTYQQISGTRVQHIAGPSGRAQPRIQIDAWASTYAAARDVAEKLRQRLDGFSGTVESTDSPPATLVLDWVRLDQEREFYEADAKVHRVSQDYFFSYREA